jgi:3-hydroxyisobutyrate dehydrogenase-like beta-hydroxyacid dehydrogenase
MAEQLAFLGLGGMGVAMAKNLLKAGHQLNVYNRTASKAAPLQELGAHVSNSPAEAVQGASVVLTMVTDDAALETITTGPDGLLSSLAPGAVHVSCSTVAPDTNRRLAEAHQQHGSALVAMPVFGKPEVAEAGKLWLVIAGATAAKQKVAPYLGAIGQGTYDFGEDPGAASLVKLCGNFMLGAAIEAMAEAFTLAQKSGIDRQKVHEFFSNTLFDCAVYKNYGKLIASQNYQPVGAEPVIIRKDFKLILREAQDQVVPMPFANIVFDQLSATVARGRENIDWASFAQLAADNAGLGQKG